MSHRVRSAILDGIDEDYPTSYGDLVVNALDLQVYPTALSLTCLVAMASAGLASLASTVLFRGPHVRVIGRLGKPIERFLASCLLQESTVRRPTSTSLLRKISTMKLVLLIREAFSKCHGS